VRGVRLAELILYDVVRRDADETLERARLVGPAAEHDDGVERERVGDEGGVPEPVIPLEAHERCAVVRLEQGDPTVGSVVVLVLVA
jgi:hypothetical protein